MMNLTFNDVNEFKKYINNTKSSDFALDLSNRNLFDGLKFLVLSSSYFYQKFPENKLKCVVNSDDIKSLVSDFEVKNLEFV